MAEATQLVFSNKEVATALVKAHGLHEGIWGLYLKFGISGTNIATGPDQIFPAAIVPVIEIGLQKFDEENSISVNAAEVNPVGLPLGEPVKAKK